MDSNFSTARTAMTILLRDRLLETIPLSVNNGYKREHFNVYPNPTSDFLYLHTDQEVMSISIYNPFGQKVIQQKSKKINTFNLPSGVYYMRVKTKEKKIQLIPFSKK